MSHSDRKDFRFERELEYKLFEKVVPDEYTVWRDDGIVAAGDNSN